MIPDAALDADIKNKIDNDSLTVYNYDRDLLERDKTIEMIVDQYERRMADLKRENEANQSRIDEMMTKSLKFEARSHLLKAQNNENLDKLNLEIMQVLQEANECTIKLANLAEIEQDDVKKSILNEITEEIKVFNGKTGNEKFVWADQLREIMCVTFEKWALDLNRIIKLEMQIENLKERHKVTMEQVVINREEDNKKWEGKMSEMRDKLTKLTKMIENEREIYRKNVERLETQNSQMSKENNKGVNIGFLKNVLLSYLTTTESSVKEKMLPVIYTMLNFNDDDIAKVSEVEKKKGFGGWFE